MQWKQGLVSPAAPGGCTHRFVWRLPFCFLQDFSLQGKEEWPEAFLGRNCTLGFLSFIFTFITYLYFSVCLILSHFYPVSLSESVLPLLRFIFPILAPICTCSSLLVIVFIFTFCCTVSTCVHLQKEDQKLSSSSQTERLTSGFFLLKEQRKGFDRLSLQSVCFFRSWVRRFWSGCFISLISRSILR